jgi:glycosyltransferase involved in cell wall biosynthesis
MKLSIITINYNNCAGLQKTIDSVVAQTWRDFEWIVIDGGSTDGSKELIEKYQDYFAYWCSEPDKGVYNAMNKGVVKAKGDYLLFLNSGDILYTNNTLAEIEKAKYDADIVTGIVLRSTTMLPLRHHNENLVKQLIQDTLSHQGTLIKRSLFDKYRYREDYRIVSDWVAWLEWLLKQNCSFQTLDIIVAVQDMDGISNTQFNLLREERQIVLKDFLGKRIAKELPILYKEQDYLKGELQIPAVNMLRYLYYNAPKWFSVLYRVILITVKMKDFLFRKTSYNSFESK